MENENMFNDIWKKIKENPIETIGVFLIIIIIFVISLLLLPVCAIIFLSFWIKNHKYGEQIISFITFLLIVLITTLLRYFFQFPY